MKGKIGGEAPVHKTERRVNKEVQKTETKEMRVDDDSSNVKEINAGGMGWYKEGNQWKGITIARYGKDGRSSNDEWLYTLKGRRVMEQ